MAKVIVVGSAIEREHVAVVEEHAKLQREPMEQSKHGDSSLTLDNVVPLKSQTLPRQRSPKEVKEHVSEGLQIISPS
jgi:hypothetical protein